MICWRAFMSGADNDDELIRRSQAKVGLVLRQKWTIDRLIGVGGMAAVYAATHRNKKRAAIKLLHPELSLSTDIRARFLREGYVANSVGHPGAVRVDDDDVSEDGSAFLVMELLEGESIEARRVRKGGRLPLKEVFSIADQLLDVLSAAHANGVVHRDLKPDNLFLNHNGQLKVLDFGIARVREVQGMSAGTRTGSLLGTPAFMAPEQARGRWEQVDAHTDLWAVGATMFTLLSGRYVHEAETLNEALALAITQPPRKVASVFPEVPAAVAEVIDRSLAYEIKDRYEDAQSMQRALRAAHSLPIQAGEAARTAALSLPDIPPATLEPLSGAQSEPKPTATAEPETRASEAKSDAKAEPEAREEPAIPTSQPQVPAPSPTLTTAPAVTARVSRTSTPPPAKKKGPPIVALAGGATALAALVAIGLAVTMSGGSTSERGARSGNGAVSQEPLPVAPPVVSGKLDDPSPIVPLEQLAVETTGKVTPSLRDKPPGQPAASALKASPVPPGRPLPAFLQSAMSPPPPPPSASPKKNTDPFSRRR
jgi:serine/threonine-protein kinase